MSFTNQAPVFEMNFSHDKGGNLSFDGVSLGAGARSIEALMNTNRVGGYDRPAIAVPRDSSDCRNSSNSDIDAKNAAKKARRKAAKKARKR
ncbi:hypothetical protein [Citricoccus nitrophenolicus]|uniref:hypothetical protein n=1 Tax=Citricoccus nitrophenolicus TaxID=863575 RepID=UPI0031E94A80